VVAIHTRRVRSLATFRRKLGACHDAVVDRCRGGRSARRRGAGRQRSGSVVRTPERNLEPGRRRQIARRRLVHTSEYRRASRCWRVGPAHGRCRRIVDGSPGRRSGRRSVLADAAGGRALECGVGGRTFGTRHRDRRGCNRSRRRRTLGRQHPR
jgi:hypothetical protein